jgi:hypothetical protein
MIERYATVTAWAEWLEKREGVRISINAIWKRVTKTGSLRKAEGLDGGQRLKFFSEKDVRQACADILIPNLPKCGEDGFINVAGIRCGTKELWSRELAIAPRTILLRIRSNHIESIKGKDQGGHIQDYYSEPSIRELCADLLTPLPTANKDGFITVNGVRHGTLEALAISLGISKSTFYRRHCGKGLTSLRGKDRSGRPCDFYPEPDARKLCADLLTPLPTANKDGFITVNGVRYITVGHIAGLMKIGESAVNLRLDGCDLVPVKGRSKTGNVRDFYPEPAVREACADLLAPLPVADKSGFVDIGGIRHGTIRSFVRVLGLSDLTILDRISESKITSVRGKMKDGNVRDFYPEPAVRAACADILRHVLKAGEAGFFVLNGIRHGTANAWSSELGVSPITIGSRARLASIQLIKGRAHGGQLRDFYPEPAVREACRDLIERKKSNPKPR